MRKLLKDLGLESDNIDKVMTEHGKTVSTFQDKLDKAVEEQKEVSNKYVEVKEKLNEVEELRDNYTKLQETLTEKEKQVQRYETVNKLKGAKVNEQYLDYVRFEVDKLVDDEKDFDTALSEYIESNPQYVETKKQKVNTQGKLDGNANDNLKAEVKKAFAR